MPGIFSFDVFNDATIFGDIIDQGYYGQDEREPHSDLRENGKLRNVCNHQDNHNHLHGGFDFAPHAGSNYDTLIGGDEPEAADDKFARYDD